MYIPLSSLKRVATASSGTAVLRALCQSSTTPTVYSHSFFRQAEVVSLFERRGDIWSWCRTLLGFCNRDVRKDCCVLAVDHGVTIG